MNNYLTPPWGEPKGSPIRYISPISPISLIRPISLPPPLGGTEGGFQYGPYYFAARLKPCGFALC